MNVLTSEANPISVLVVDEEPSILVFIARLLNADGMRALLARSGGEALEIAERNFVPIDMILANAAILKLREPDLLNRLRQIRPGVRELCMAACVDRGVVRIQLMVGGSGMESAACDDGFVESIRKVGRHSPWYGGRAKQVSRLGVTSSNSFRKLTLTPAPFSGTAREKISCIRTTSIVD